MTWKRHLIKIAFGLLEAQLFFENLLRQKKFLALKNSFISGCHRNCNIEFFVIPKSTLWWGGYFCLFFEYPWNNIAFAFIFSNHNMCGLLIHFSPKYRTCTFSSIESFVESKSIIHILFITWLAKYFHGNGNRQSWCLITQLLAA